MKGKGQVGKESVKGRSGKGAGMDRRGEEVHGHEGKKEGKDRRGKEEGMGR